MITKIEHLGKLIHECSLEGHTRADGCAPAHPNGYQISKNRWLITYSIRGWRGIDDEWALAFQIRDRAPDGKVIKEGLLRQKKNDWDPLASGEKMVRQYGHPVAFGIPRGAMINGQRPCNENIIALCWRVVGRYIDPKTGFLPHFTGDFDRIRLQTAWAEWMQVRLNAAEDDLEIVMPPQNLVQKGYEDSASGCVIDSSHRMVMVFTPPIAFNQEKTEWVVCNHFEPPNNHSKLGILKFSFNNQTKLYEWEKTSPLIEHQTEPLCETTLVNLQDNRFLLVGRSVNPKSSASKLAMLITDDLFKPNQQPKLLWGSEYVPPVSAFTCADGQIRFFSSRQSESPNNIFRDPLFCWDLDVETFNLSHKQIIFHAYETLPKEFPRSRMCDFCKVFPHSGGSTQFFAHRVWTTSTLMPNEPHDDGHVVTELEKELCGVYYGKIHYDQDYPTAWNWTA